MSSCSLLPFSRDTLSQALSNPFASVAEVSCGRAVKYLHEYFTKLEAQTIVIEDPYTDADFLDDYTAYYARCYTSYSRRCKRLHFFRRKFTQDQIFDLVSRVLTESDQAALESDYLGFVVARPLPQAIIGRTLVKTYESDGHRHFPVSRSYKLNFFGIGLELKSLAFQEQDTIIAACATVALWSAFHKTARLFDTYVPTPAVITRAATQAIHYGRPIPQHGLRVEEICSAIRNAGLEPEAMNLQRTKDVPLASLLYGYLRMGLPAVLIVAIPKRGWHAITLTGYSLRGSRHAQNGEVPNNPYIVPMIGLRIDKFYGHDDQIGPNARLELEQSPMPGPVETRCPIKLKSSWSDPDGNPFLYPVAVVVPIYNKIRLTFLELQTWISPLHTVLAGVVPQSSRIEWDVHLIFSNDFKAEIRHDETLDTRIRQSLAMQHQPRFWWRAVFCYRGLSFCELLFDATGIGRSFPVSLILWRVESFAKKVELLFSDAAKKVAIDKMLKSERYVSFLIRSLEVRGAPGELLRD